jgi:hypothetical protein
MVMVGADRELGDLVWTCFLGCKWLFEVVVTRVMLSSTQLQKLPIADEDEMSI